MKIVRLVIDRIVNVLHIVFEVWGLCLHGLIMSHRIDLLGQKPILAWMLGCRHEPFLRGLTIW